MAAAVKLRAGLLEAEFEDGRMRGIAYRGVEIVRGIYAAVRDRNWGTVAPELTVEQLQQADDAATVQFHCRHVQDQIDFEWNGAIDMTPGGIRFDFDGLARTTFLKNRIGFCVLHPLGFAGLPVDVHTEEGVSHGAFPAAISPHQPFKAIREMVFEPADGIRVRMTFSGDLFEMEDQRNWTDASYKTYCTPLERPYPVQMQAGERIKQSVWIEIERTGVEAGGRQHGERTAQSVPGESGRRGVEADGMRHGEQSRTVRIEVLSETIGPLPEIGFAVPVGGIPPEEAPMIAKLKPAHLRDTLDLTGSGWTARWETAREAAGRIGCGLELEVLLDADERGAAEAAALAECLAADRVDRSGRETSEAAELTERLAANGLVTGVREVTVRLLPFSKGAVASDEAALRVVREALRVRGLNVSLGGGSRAYYAEFNRATLPLAGMDFAAYTINPQVHAFDDRSLVETLAAQQVTASDAAAKSGKPLSIGPITFKPRLNPNATSGDGSIPLAEQVDDRFGAEFGAAWTLGSLAALCVPEVRWLTYYEASGPLGLVQDGAAIPSYHLLKEVMEEPDAQVQAVHGSTEQVAALALRRPGGSTRLLVANLTSEPLDIVVIDAGRRLTLQSYGWARIDKDVQEADAPAAGD